MTKLCNGAQTANFLQFFMSCISSEPRAAHFRPAFQIHTKATPCVEVRVLLCYGALEIVSVIIILIIQSAAAEIRQGKKERRNKPQGKNIKACHIP